MNSIAPFRNYSAKTSNWKCYRHRSHPSLATAQSRFYTRYRGHILERSFGSGLHGGINRHATFLANQFSFHFITNCYSQPEASLQERQDAVHSTSNPRGLQRCPIHHCQCLSPAVPGVHYSRKGTMFVHKRNSIFAEKNHTPVGTPCRQLLTQHPMQLQLQYLHTDPPTDFTTCN